MKERIFVFDKASKTGTHDCKGESLVSSQISTPSSTGLQRMRSFDTPGLGFRIKLHPETDSSTAPLY